MSVEYLWRGQASGSISTVEVNALADLLDPTETAQIARLRSSLKRIDAIIAHGLRRRLLAELTGAPANSFHFTRTDPLGKPRLQGCPDIDVSLTHCEGFAAAAVTAQGRVGIDAEKRGRDLPDAVFSMIATSHERAMTDDALGLWTVKEALAKAEGSGLALDFRSIETDPATQRLCAAPASFGATANWHLRRHVQDGFTVAIGFAAR